MVTAQHGSVVLRAPAKINCFLRVVGRRADGYHLLETMMQKVALYDEIELTPISQGIQLHCLGADLPTGADNLVHRAAALFLQSLREATGKEPPGVRLQLTKRIPVAAGLGGGSSDAAATLLGLNRLLGTDLAPETLAAMGLQLGADVPFFLAPSPAALATGIGEVLRPVAPLAGYRILLVNPGFAVATRWVYQNFSLTNKERAGNLSASRDCEVAGGVGERLPTAWSPCQDTGNDLETVTVAKYPEIGRLKEELLRLGATLSLMSGSGPTVFALFTDPEAAASSYALFQRRFPHTFLVDPEGTTN